MSIFNLNGELNDFYDQCVRLKEERKKLAAYRDTCLDRLSQGLKKLGDERGTTYKTFKRSIGQGSYPMFTLNKHPNDEYDIDVAVIFDKDDIPAKPDEARKLVADALLVTGGNFKKEPEARTNAVTVWYADGAHVDLAIYREVEGILWNSIEHSSGTEWGKRDPEAVTNWFIECVDRFSPLFLSDVDAKQLRRIVRWLKWFTRSRLAWSLPGGIIVTVLAVECYCPDRARDDVALYNTLKSIRSRLERSLDVRNPVDSSKSLTPKPKFEAQVKRLLEKLEFILPTLSLLENEDCSREQALRAWGKFFNHEWWGQAAEDEEPADPVSKSGRIASLHLSVGVASGEGARTAPYAGDRPLPKNKWLKFRVPNEWRQLHGVTYRWTVTNTGDEARADRDMGHVSDERGETWRRTAYKGTHSMTCEVVRDGEVLARGTRRVRVAVW